MPFVPSVEEISNNKSFLTECYLNKIKKGDSFHGEHIFGHTSLETNAVGRVIERLREGMAYANYNIIISTLIDTIFNLILSFLTLYFRILQIVRFLI